MEILEICFGASIQCCLPELLNPNHNPVIKVTEFTEGHFSPDLTCVFYCLFKARVRDKVQMMAGYNSAYVFFFLFVVFVFV